MPNLHDVARVDAQWRMPGDRAVVNHPQVATAVHSARYEKIDGLRALAMIAVIAQHTELMPFGWIGVWIFYVISGFVVTLSVDSLRGKQRPIAEFYVRRIARIVPMYALYVIAAALIGMCIDPQFRIAAVLSQLTFTYNFYLIHDLHVPVVPTSHLWTISTEMQFYALAGFALITVPRRLLARVMIAVIGLSVLARLLLAEMFAPGFDVVTHLGFVTFDAFAAGCLLALYKDQLTPARAFRLMCWGAVAMGAYVLAYMVVNHHMGAQGTAIARKIVSGNASGQGRDVVLFSAITLFGFGIVAYAAAGKGLFATLLARPWLVDIGRASYSGYLIHFGVIVLLRTGFTALAARSAMVGRVMTHGGGVLLFAFVLFVASTVITVALAWPIYRHLEMPLARSARRKLEGLLALA